MPVCGQTIKVSARKTIFNLRNENFYLFFLLSKLTFDCSSGLNGNSSVENIWENHKFLRQKQFLNYGQLASGKYQMMFLAETFDFRTNQLSFKVVGEAEFVRIHRQINDISLT
jgi:hypothetical protein